MANTVSRKMQLFPPLEDYCLLQTYQIYSTEHAGGLIAPYADLTLWSLNWSSVVAAGAKKELNLLWDWQLRNRGHCLDKKEAIFELHIFGEYKVLGLQFGADGTKLIYISTIDLARCRHFYDPITTMIETGYELTAGQLLDDQVLDD